MTPLHTVSKFSEKSPGSPWLNPGSATISRIQIKLEIYLNLDLKVTILLLF